MPNYKMLLQYDGTRYSGWQKQGNTENTIQGKVEGVLSRLLNSPTEVHGSGRTDAGVHALGQVANFHGNPKKENGSPLSPLEIQTYLNQYLPTDICVTELQEASSRFHARLNARQKHYRYRIDNSAAAHVFQRKYVARFKTNYDLNVMRHAADLLLGEHDFKSFCENKHMKKSTIRILDKITISETDGILCLDFYGNGFLYHMVRILTGTLLEVGEGKRQPEQIPSILKACSRPAAGFTAPAQGLFLMEVFY